MYGRIDPRGTYSIAMYGIVACSKYSYTVTMLGWLSEPAIRDSRRKRWAYSAEPAWKRLSSLSATCRSRSGWRATYTTAMPPRPISRRIS